jgi:uncharacterized cupredoxin-like copper-binding protein
MKTRIIFALVAGALWAGPAMAHGPDAHSHGGSQAHGPAIEGGKPGKAGDATRTVTVVAKDTVFEPKTVAVNAGETIRFIVRNEGKLVHELTIGSKAMQLEHQNEMLEFAASGAIAADRVDRSKVGNHSHGNNVLLEPGQSGEIVWTFAAATDLEFGCNVPGHYEQGMKGEFRFR